MSSRTVRPYAAPELRLGGFSLRNSDYHALNDLGQNHLKWLNLHALLARFAAHGSLLLRSAAGSGTFCLTTGRRAARKGRSDGAGAERSPALVVAAAPLPFVAFPQPCDR